jgi:diguanylate cyclase (GGDEF)-like protein
MRERGWLLWPLLGAVAISGYFLLPADGLPRPVLYNVIGLASAVTIAVGVRLRRPPRTLLWYCFAAGQAVWVIGDVMYDVYDNVLDESPFPSPADAVYLAAYPILVTGLFLLIRGRTSGRDRAGLIDACVIATGLGLLSWTFLMRPIAHDTSLEPLARVFALAYPAADVLLLVMLARLVTSPGARTVSYRLLVAALLLVLGADVAFSVVSTFSSYTGGVMDAGWLASYVLWGAAALHPSMRSLSEVAPDRAVRFGRGRLTLLVATCLLAPAILFAQGLRQPHDIDWIAIGAGAVVLFVLVLVRMSGLIRQVTQQSSRMATLALHDDLTGLPNRRLLHRRVRAAIGKGAGARTHVALIDLDDFKDVNDRLGHALGDQLLVGLGQRLLAAARPADTVARLGGDEFALLITDATAAEADAVVERVREELRTPIVIGDHDLLARASVGVADGAGASEPFELLRRADIAMYAAKERRAAFLRYRSEMDERAIEYAELGAQLRHGLDKGEFELVYQPIVTLPEGRLASVEALVRWRHPRRGLLSPVDFVPVAERNGLIVELGDWVLREACQQMVRWYREYGPDAPARVSVNVSARQLRQPGFADSVVEALADTGLPARRLVVEVTETAVFGGGPAVDELEALHDLGVRVALDDFGTGHSSLGLLQTCPVDTIKVDKSFVENITRAGRHSVIAAALINLSDGLSLAAIAEGVETAEQAEQLCRLGYRYAQGFHFGRPMAADELAPRLAAGRSPATVAA